MAKFMIHVSQSRTQTRISIPKVIAKATGLDSAEVAIIEDMEDKSIVIKEFKVDGKKEGGLQEDQT